MSSIDYGEKIPNNVNLQNDRTLQRALERWQPQFLQWWHEMGPTVWQQVPGEYRSTLRRLIVTQGDTEPASVEQQRMLGHTCPSLYDLRNLFQINVEEGRHLWAMVYLLHAYFGRDGR